MTIWTVCLQDTPNSLLIWIFIIPSSSRIEIGAVVPEVGNWSVFDNPSLVLMRAILGENLTRVCAVAWALSSVIDLPRLSAFRTSFPVLALLVWNRAATTNYRVCFLFRSTISWPDELFLRIAVVGFRRSMKDFSFVTFVGIFFRSTFI